MMTKNFASKLALTAIILSTTACALDDATEPADDDDAEVSYKLGLNKLGLNKLGLNKLGLNKLGLNKLGLNGLATTTMMANADSREVYSYVVGCALPAGQSITAKDSAGVSYTFTGALGLAPAWGTRAPTVSERRWVSACLLARTNIFGIQVQISLRHDTNVALTTTAAERTQFSNVEGAFYGDLFTDSVQSWFACGSRAWSAYTTNSLRMCALSSNGATTDCNFTYTGACTAACTDTTAPFSGCNGASVRYPEVITIFLTPTQQQGQAQ
jgi:hypothetical protein